MQFESFPATCKACAETSIPCLVGLKTGKSDQVITGSHP